VVFLSSQHELLDHTIFSPHFISSGPSSTLGGLPRPPPSHSLFFFLLYDPFNPSTRPLMIDPCQVSHFPRLGSEGLFFPCGPRDVHSFEFPRKCFASCVLVSRSRPLLARFCRAAVLSFFHCWRQLAITVFQRWIFLQPQRCIASSFGLNVFFPAIPLFPCLSLASFFFLNRNNYIQSSGNPERILLFCPSYSQGFSSSVISTL